MRRAIDEVRRDANAHVSRLRFLRLLDIQETAWAHASACAGRPALRLLDEALRWVASARRSWNGPDLITFVHRARVPGLQRLAGDPMRDTASAWQRVIAAMPGMQRMHGMRSPHCCPPPPAGGTARQRMPGSPRQRMASLRTEQRRG
ncbi:MAG: hypothetical protein RML84_11240 [Anaerolineae bacterium]|nr:hypothetical protein [Anaerolineae bacterium]